LTEQQKEEFKQSKHMSKKLSAGAVQASLLQQTAESAPKGRGRAGTFYQPLPKQLDHSADPKPVRKETQFSELEKPARKETVFSELEGARPHAGTVYNPLPTHLGARKRAEAHSEKTMPEQATDLMDQVDPSAAGVRLNKDTQCSRLNRRHLDKYIELREQPLASGVQERQKQFKEMDLSLQKLHKDKKIGEMAKNESQLLADTFHDDAIMNSKYVNTPNHAIELKRHGLQPSVAGKVGAFTDVRLTEDGMKMLGQGGANTVYKGTYTLPDSGKQFVGVFKPLQKTPDITGPGGLTGITEKDSRLAYRDVATTRLDEAMNAGLITRSEMGIHQQQLGTVSELAKGTSLKGDKIVGNERVPEDRLAHAENMLGMKRTDPSFIKMYNESGVDKKETGEPRHLGVKDVNGRKEFFYEGTTMRNVNYNEPGLRRDLVTLQLMDNIAGQVDRHPGNYFVNQDTNGKFLGMKAIDNDQAWGSKLKMVEEHKYKSADILNKRGELVVAGKLNPIDSHLPTYLPPVVDKKAYDSIMGMNAQTFQTKMGGLLSRDEMTAASERLRLVQNHISDPQKCRVLRTEADWAGDDVKNLLLQKKNNEHTSYFARDFSLQQKAQQEGFLIPYFQDSKQEKAYLKNHYGL
jgi:hypothetical protein